ncbi:MAG: hypothetical protein RL748_3623 [Pseudomonadota bacterium]|jgi:hypothetical protein
MNELNPSMAAGIASGVYTLRKDADWNTMQALGKKIIDTNLGITDQFSLQPSDRFKGTSGGNLIRTEAGFGYLAEGVNTRKGELLIGIRGTVHALDWVTDLAQALRRGPSGHPVHGGFLRTFESFEPVIGEYLRHAGSLSTVHVVGHSLGGALATLTADYLQLRGMNVKLYSFGSPRVGTNTFSQYLTQKLKAENVFRVSNQSDPVTMVPIFPFFHVPNDQAQYLIPSWHGINPFNHMMGKYIPSVEGKTWANLNEQASKKSWSEQVELWLESAGSNSSGIQMYSAKALWMIMKALNWIVGQALHAVGVVAGLGALGVVTVLDQLTQILHQGVLESIKIAEWVGSLIAGIMKFLGRTVVAGAKMTANFIRWVLELLFKTLSTMAYMALHNANK